MQYKAILFDLDNTLILFKETEFFSVYTQKLYPYFSQWMRPDEFGQRMMLSTHKMAQNDGSKINVVVFMEAFASGLDADIEELWSGFDTFYTQEFQQFRSIMRPIPGLRFLFNDLLKTDLKIVIATNPMFPMIVQQFRLDWSGLEGFDFDLVTHVENSSFCKPNPGYYHEICQKLKLAAPDCLMVGNDPFNDMIASKIGMRTYLTTDSEDLSIELSRELAGDEALEFPPPDGRGSILELPAFLYLDRTDK